MVSSNMRSKAEETLNKYLLFKKHATRDFKIFSDDNKTRTRKSLDRPQRKIAGKPPMATRKSVPANLASDQLGTTQNAQKSASFRTSGASIVKNNCDSENIDGRKCKSMAMKDGKSASKPLPAARKYRLSEQTSKDSPSSKSKSVKGTQLRSRSCKGNVRYLEKTKGKTSISDAETIRKPLLDISNIRNHKLSGTSDGSKLIKIQSGKCLSKPSRTLLTNKKVKDADTSSRKTASAFGRTAKTSSKCRVNSKLNGSCTDKKAKAIAEISSIKIEKVPSGPPCQNSVCVFSNGCHLDICPSNGDEFTSKSIVAVISKPRNKHRKSYTSSIMERSKVLGESASGIKKQLPNIDDATNHLEVAEYVYEIYQFYWFMEQQERNPFLASYMERQQEITPRMRGILINWLIEVHLKFDLMQETLFLMVDLLDRFLSVVMIKKAEMQLVGLTALLLASKYEDYWHPKIRDLLSISTNMYTRDQMIAMEKLILKKLMFRLTAPTPYVFMLRFLKAAKSDQKLEHFAFYLIELCLLEYEALIFKSSILCASAIYVARCSLQLTPAWTELLAEHTHYEEYQLRPCAEMILRFQKAAGQGPLKVSYEKYLVSDYSCVATFKAMDRLPS